MKAGKRGRLDPAEQRLRLARRLVEQGKHAEAIPVLSRVQQDGTKPKSEKDSVLVTVLLGTAYLGLNKVEEAAKHLDPLAEKTPAPPELKLALARLDLRRGNDEKAEKHLKDALEGSPQKGAVLFELGRLYERQGKPAKALECYRTALEEAYPRDSRSFSQTRE